MIETRDYRPLPGSYGFGSSTLAAWIQRNLDRDAAAGGAKKDPPVILRGKDGDGSVTIGGELKQWHKITLTLDGPYAQERDNDPNPFTDYLVSVRFTHESGKPDYTVPAYFAADGNAAETSADAGTKWRAHLSPDKVGRWTYRVSFQKGRQVIAGKPSSAFKPYDGLSGNFSVSMSDKSGRDFRGKGRLQYLGERYLRFAGADEYFLKAGTDAPETLLAYADFDGTEPGRKRDARTGEAAPSQALHRYEPHLRDWHDDDPTWQGGKGRGLIGALNYLAGKGVNAFSFLTYNAGGDGDNVWPFVARTEKLHYDCSKLDQWGVVFDHASQLGLFLHFKLQENEIDDNRRGDKKDEGEVPESLDGGKLGIERRLYLRELVARFGHALALNWNLGEENTQSTEEIVAMGYYLRDIDPYRHPIVIHTFPHQQEQVYSPLLGPDSPLAGASLQNSWNAVHARTLRWLEASAKAGKPWVVANDEQNPAGLGVPPDAGYAGHDGVAIEKEKKEENVGTGDVKARAYSAHDIRKLALWGNLMAGGAGVEYYFGYQLPQNDLVCEDWRSRDRSWDWCRIALDFFREQKIPFWEMQNADGLIGNPKNENSRYCFAKVGELYLVYLPSGGTSPLNLSGVSGEFSVSWFNPRTGGDLIPGTPKVAIGGGEIELASPSGATGDDWLAVVRR
jgi:hypothetical protein